MTDSSQTIVFKAKVGYGLLIPTVLIITGCFVWPALDGAPATALWIMAGILVPTLAFVLHMFYGTAYFIADGYLRIKCGFFRGWNINIQQISTVRRTRNPLSSPAPSLDRLELRYNKYDTVMVSPADKEGFLSALQTINPEIQVL